jgi:hypothetical protein
MNLGSVHSGWKRCKKRGDGCGRRKRNTIRCRGIYRATLPPVHLSHNAPSPQCPSIPSCSLRASSSSSSTSGYTSSPSRTCPQHDLVSKTSLSCSQTFARPSQAGPDLRGRVPHALRHHQRSHICHWGWVTLNIRCWCLRTAVLGA